MSDHARSIFDFRIDFARAALLTAAAVTVFTAGCASDSRLLHCAEQSPTAAVVPDVEVVADPVASGPSINVFGEVDGRPVNAGSNASEHGFQQHTESDEGYDADVVADPTGQWLAFSSTRHAEKPDIYLKHVDGQSVIQLTSDPADDVQPAFSPDGQRVAFASSRAGNWDLYLMDLDGKNIELLTGLPAMRCIRASARMGRAWFTALSRRAASSGSCG